MCLYRLCWCQTTLKLTVRSKWTTTYLTSTYRLSLLCRACGDFRNASLPPSLHQSEWSHFPHHRLQMSRQNVRQRTWTQEMKKQQEDDGLTQFEVIKRTCWMKGEGSPDGNKQSFKKTNGKTLTDHLICRFNAFYGVISVSCSIIQVPNTFILKSISQRNKRAENNKIIKQ